VAYVVANGNIFYNLFSAINFKKISTVMPARNAERIDRLIALHFFHRAMADSLCRSTNKYVQTKFENNSA